MLVALAFLSLDGMPIKDGRFAGGATTVLTLEPDQLRDLSSQRDLVLSRAQREALSRSAGTAPRALWIFDTRIGENDCTCNAENLGLRFNAAQIEVPHRYLRGELAPSFADWLGLTALALPLLAGAFRRIRGQGA